MAGAHGSVASQLVFPLPRDFMGGSAGSTSESSGLRVRRGLEHYLRAGIVTVKVPGFYSVDCVYATYHHHRCCRFLAVRSSLTCLFVSENILMPYVAI